MRGLTVLAALLIFAGGYVHYCLYRHGYRFLPKIGTGFLLQFTSSAVIGAALLLVPEAAPVRQHRVPLRQLARLGGIALSVGTLAALAIAHTSGGLFGFREVGLEPAPQTLVSVIVEYEAAAFLAVAMLFAHLARTGRRAPPPEPHGRGRRRPWARSPTGQPPPFARAPAARGVGDRRGSP